MNLTHPLPLGTQIKTRFPSCPCRGAKWKTTTGVVQRVQQRSISGIPKYFYILRNGYKINQDWIDEVL